MTKPRQVCVEKGGQEFLYMDSVSNNVTMDTFGILLCIFSVSSGKITYGIHFLDSGARISICSLDFARYLIKSKLFDVIKGVIYRLRTADRSKVESFGQISVNFVFDYKQRVIVA